MTNNNSLRMSEEERESLPKFLAAAEGAKEDQSSVSVVRNANSGLTVGSLQMDVSKQKDLRNDLIAVGQATGLVEANGITAELLAKDHKTLDATGKSQAVEAFAKAVLATKEGREALKKAEDKQIDFVANKTDEICAGSIPAAAAVCGTPNGRRDIAAYVHQNGRNFEELKGYVAGQKVTIGKLYEGHPGRQVQITEPLKEDGLRTAYIANTKWGQENADALKSRFERSDAANKRYPVATPPKSEDTDRQGNTPEKRSNAEDEAPATPQAVAQDRSSDVRNDADTPTSLAKAQHKAGQATPQSLQQPLPEERRQPWEAYPPRPPFNFLDPTKKSPRYNLPSGLAALLGIPHAPGGSPDGAFVDLAKQVGGDGLPPLVSDLLGAGVSRTNPKSAVKLFQTTINALNKPENFDWNWSTSGKIDVDGDLGPQTRDGFGRALEKAGPDGFARKFALGQFRDYATRLDNGVERYENLAGAVDGSLGRVDRNAAATFQDYLNVARENLPPHVRYEGLKRDGWIGPKTTDAFKTALYNLGPKTIADDLEGLFGV